MNHSFEKGDLAFLPSDLMLLQFVEAKYSPSAIKNFIKTEAPSHAIIVENETHSPYCTVLYNGERWWVPRQEIYPVED